MSYTIAARHEPDRGLASGDWTAVLLEDGCEVVKVYAQPSEVYALRTADTLRKLRNGEPICLTYVRVDDGGLDGLAPSVTDWQRRMDEEAMHGE